MRFAPAADQIQAVVDPARLDRTILLLAVGYEDVLPDGATIELRVARGPTVTLHAKGLPDPTIEPSFDALQFAELPLRRIQDGVAIDLPV